MIKKNLIVTLLDPLDPTAQTEVMHLRTTDGRENIIIQLEGSFKVGVSTKDLQEALNEVEAFSIANTSKTLEITGLTPSELQLAQMPIISYGEDEASNS